MRPSRARGHGYAQHAQHVVRVPQHTARVVGSPRGSSGFGRCCQTPRRSCSGGSGSGRSRARRGRPSARQEECVHGCGCSSCPIVVVPEPARVAGVAGVARLAPRLAPRVVMSGCPPSSQWVRHAPCVFSAAEAAAPGTWAGSSSSSTGAATNVLKSRAPGEMAWRPA